MFCIFHPPPRFLLNRQRSIIVDLLPHLSVPPSTTRHPTFPHPTLVCPGLPESPRFSLTPLANWRPFFSLAHACLSLSLLPALPDSLSTTRPSNPSPSLAHYSYQINHLPYEDLPRLAAIERSPLLPTSLRLDITRGPLSLSSRPDCLLQRLSPAMSLLSSVLTSHVF